MTKTKKRVVKKVSKKKTILPKKLSSLIGIALRDIRKAEKQEKYIVDMGTFHEPSIIVCSYEGGFSSEGRIIKREPACIVCAAGSVMAFTLKADFTKDLSPSSFKRNEAQLNAIDALRTGNAQSAAAFLDPSDKECDNLYEIEMKTYIPDYDRDNPKPFHKAMVKFQIALKKAGY